MLLGVAGAGLLALFVGNNPFSAPTDTNNNSPTTPTEIYEDNRDEPIAPMIEALPDNGLLYIPTQVQGDQLVQHQFYSVSYSSRHQNPEWVAYELTAKQATLAGQSKRVSFKADPRCATAANSRVYNRSGYDRGHLVPAFDRGFNDAAMEETFYMTNVVPQVPEFNRGIWKELESKIRKWVKIEGRLYIITGPLLRNDIEEVERISDNGPTVPRGFYKIVLDYDGSYKKGIAFMFKNKEIDQPLEKFVTTIDLVEEYTGIDFFPNLTTAEERALEAVSSAHLWDFE